MFPAQDRLVRKETALGTIREMLPPKNHIGLKILAPFEEVGSDEVIFDHIKDQADGLAPARAQDAESELARKDDIIYTEGRASILDWAIKDHYDASDITTYTEAVLLEQMIQGSNLPTTFPLTVGRMAEEYRQKVARDDARRKRKLDNRIEWLIMQALETGGIAYNDGKVIFNVDFERPSNQTDEAPLGGTFDNTTSDPIGAFLAAKEFMYDTYGVNMNRAITSRKVVNSFINSDRFTARSGMVGATGSAPVDLRYLGAGWDQEAALAVVKAATDIDFIVYDSVYRTRPLGSSTFTNNRFLSQNKVFLLPSADDVAELSDLGLAKTFTSPHPEGNWTPGFYEWEKEMTDPWGRDRGLGIKAFPVFFHMDLTYTMTVLP